MTEFLHGQTYEGMPVQSTVALEVFKEILKLISNVKKIGAYLGKRLKDELGNHPNVGDIRGKGLF